VLVALLRRLGILSEPEVLEMAWCDDWSLFLDENVAFYQDLQPSDRESFHRRVWVFLANTRIESGEFDIVDEDRLLVAASAIIPIWFFPRWRYSNLEAVILFPAAFNDAFLCYQKDSRYTGMVGHGNMHGKMALSRPALYQGFQNARDKHNVGIHEFVHLIDMADGECDGYPERLREHAYSLPWFELVRSKIHSMDISRSDIPDYGATNRVEFLAVVSEYFFERPDLLSKKHPKLYRLLKEIYQP
jgi:Mlc titration factor MtfA (ptsG expression regulator)